jgi:hypothetical protein
MLSYLGCSPYDVVLTIAEVLLFARNVSARERRSMKNCNYEGVRAGRAVPTKLVASLNSKALSDANRGDHGVDFLDDALLRMSFRW